MDIDKIIADAKKFAGETVSKSEQIRVEINAGHPNCSTEATSEGAIRAMGLWMEVDAAAMAVA